MQNGWTSFLVKVQNEAGVTAKLQAESANAQPVLHMTSYPVLEHTKTENLLNEGQVANRFIELQMYNKQTAFGQPFRAGVAICLSFRFTPRIRESEKLKLASTLDKAHKTSASVPTSLFYLTSFLQ
jgi:hypothetical protein